MKRIQRITEHVCIHCGENCGTASGVKRHLKGCSKIPVPSDSFDETSPTISHTPRTPRLLPHTPLNKSTVNDTKVIFDSLHSLRLEIENLKLSTSHIREIRNDVDILKSIGQCSSSTPTNLEKDSTIAMLREQIDCLKQMNAELRTTCSCKQEKEHAKKTQQQPPEQQNKHTSSWKKPKNPVRPSLKPSDDSNISLNNRFKAFNWVNDDLNISVESDKHVNAVGNRRTIRNHRKITIIGDSMLSGVKANRRKLTEKIEKQDEVYVKDHSGATIDDLNSYIIPVKKRSPELVIIHGGTNDLRSHQTAEQIGKSIVHLAEFARNETNEVVISGIIPRADNLNTKAEEVNKVTRKLCIENKILFMDNSDFPKKMLHGHLHLNNFGVSYFISKLSNLIHF